MLSVSPNRSFFQTVSWYLRLFFPLSSPIFPPLCFLFLTLFTSPALAFNMTHLGIYFFSPPYPSVKIPVLSPAVKFLQDVLWSQSMISHQLLYWHVSASLPLLCSRTGCVCMMGCVFQQIAGMVGVEMHECVCMLMCGFTYRCQLPAILLDPMNDCN